MKLKDLINVLCKSSLIEISYKNGKTMFTGLIYDLPRYIYDDYIVDLVFTTRLNKIYISVKL